MVIPVILDILFLWLQENMNIFITAKLKEEKAIRFISDYFSCPLLFPIVLNSLCPSFFMKRGFDLFNYIKINDFDNWIFL